MHKVLVFRRINGEIPSDPTGTIAPGGYREIAIEWPGWSARLGIRSGMFWGWKCRLDGDGDGGREENACWELLPASWSRAI
jgi:hypothetical protein